MASVGLANLQQFILKDVEGLHHRREKGRGCYGAVYEVRLHGVPCIAKRLHDILVGRGQEEPVSAADRRAAIRKFREECVLLSDLRHPNIVQMLGVHCGGRDEADISLIMEYMHMDLEHCMKTYPDIPLPYKTSILRDVAYGLAYLHSLPIIHRDLNAGNVLLTESLRAKIADLGVAKLLERETAMIRTRTVCPGALDYMAPECLEESPKYDVKLDVFSFGHLTIYLANQKPPRTLDSAVTVDDVLKNQRQVGKRRRALDQLSGSCHPLYSIVIQCLSDTPDQRPTSRDLVRRMEEICNQHHMPHENTLQTLAELSNKVKLENELAELKESLTTKDRNLAELSGSLRTKDCQLSESRAALTVKNQQVAELSGSLRTKDHQLSESRAALTVKNQQLAELSGLLRTKDQQLSESMAALTARDQQVAELSGSLRTKDRQLSESRAALTVKNQQLTELSGSLRIKDRQLSESRAALPARDQLQQLAELSGSLRTKDNQLAELKEELKCEVRQLHRHSPMALSSTPRALKSTSEPTEELRGAHSGQTIVGIDLGMSSCSMSYRINNTGPVESVELPQGCATIPIVLLLRKLDGHNCRVERIGADAKRFVTSLFPANFSKYHYFDLIMLFHRHKNVDREMPITSFEEPFYLVEVLALILKYLKQLLMRRLDIIFADHEAIMPADIHWVITVPVEWNQLVRESACLACLWSRHEGICKLTPFGNKLPLAVGPTKNITIASRSYCTALRFCNYHNDDMADYSDRCDLHEVQKRCLIVDVGKNTVDITALVYTPTDSCYEFVVPTVTHTVGGMQVNENFSNFLQYLVDDHEFSRFLMTKKAFSCSLSKDSLAITNMINDDFERLKNHFGMKGLEQTQKFRMVLERRFLDFYMKQFFLKRIQRHGDSRISFNTETHTLEIEYSKMADFYEPVLQEIQRHVVCALDKVPLDSIDAVCFAGEFGGCRYVYEHMKTALSSHHKLRQAAFLAPLFYGVVASQGAVYYCQPMNIITQVMDASYGINATVPDLCIFREDELMEKNTEIYSEGIILQQNVFLPFVYQGEQVKTTDVFTVSDLVPPQQSQTEISFHVYRSTNPKVRHTTDEDTEKIGELTLDLPIPNNLPNSEQKLKISMNFSLARIITCAQALYLPDQPMVSIVL